MVPSVPTSPLDPSTKYTILEFLDICKLDEQVTELVIMRIVDKVRSKNPRIHPAQITATGAEFLQAIGGSKLVAERFRRGPFYMQVPGGGQINLSEPMPLLFTAMFRKLRK